MPYDVDIKHVPDQQVASVRVRTTLATIGAAIGDGFAVLMGALTDAATQPTGAPFVIYHDVIDGQTEGDIEICIPVSAGTAASHPEVEVRAISGCTVAATTHRGPYDEISPAYDTVTRWIQDHGHQVAGPPRELYLNDPQDVLPEEVLTKVQFPIDDPA